VSCNQTALLLSSFAIKSYYCLALLLSKLITALLPHH
jgi:hypothetical protein